MSPEAVVTGIVRVRWSPSINRKLTWNGCRDTHVSDRWLRQFPDPSTAEVRSSAARFACQPLFATTTKPCPAFRNSIRQVGQVPKFVVICSYAPRRSATPALLLGRLNAIVEITARVALRSMALVVDSAQIAQHLAKHPDD